MIGICECRQQEFLYDNVLLIWTGVFARGILIKSALSSISLQDERKKTLNNKRKEETDFFTTSIYSGIWRMSCHEVKESKAQCHGV